MKTNEEIDDMIKDYIEDENEFSTLAPPKIYLDVSDPVTMDSMGNPSDYSDLFDNTLDTIDISSITLTDTTVAGTIDISDNYNKDVTMEIDGKQRSMRELFDTVEAIEKRLGILRPDPKLLDKYELLQSLYEQYKAAEAMLYEDEDEEEEFPF